jgi:hypothetical protein
LTDARSYASTSTQSMGTPVTPAAIATRSQFVEYGMRQTRN